MTNDYRDRVAEAIRAAADYPIVAEWICCDPVNPDHDLCVKGDIARQMLQAVLADDEEKLFLPSGVVDAVLAVRDQDAETLRSDNEELRKRADAAEAEVARLRAGEADQPAPDGTTLTPAQWLRRYNDATPEKRLQVAEHVQDSAERAYRCFMADHDGMREEFHHQLGILARVRAGLDALIEAGFGATTDTLRELRAGLDDRSLAEEADRG